MAEPKELLASRELAEVLEERRAALRAEMERTDEDGSDVTVIVHKYVLKEIQLLDQEISTSHVAKNVDAAKFPNTFANLTGESCVVRGIEVTYHVPFRGPAFLLECKSQVRSTLPIVARLSDDELQFSVECVDSQGIRGTARRFEDDLRVLREIVHHINSKVREFNRWLPADAESFRSGRNRVQSELNALGYRLRSRVGDKKDTHSTQKGNSAQSRDREGAREETEYQIAVSFASEEGESARQVAQQLRRRDVRVFDYEDQQAALWGKDLAEELGVVFGGGSDFVLMLISEHYVRKIWTMHERRHAQAHALAKKSDYILPVRLDDTPLPGMPSTVAYQDLRRITVEQPVELILRKLDARRTAAG